MLKKLSVLSFMVVLLASAVVIADSKNKADSKTGEYKTFSGTLVCQGCDLKKNEGARAACNVYGHKHALKTDDGKYINFLENKFSEDLVNGEKYQNRKIKINGNYYASANMIDIDNFTVDEKMKSWCDHCQAMDGCMAGKKGM